MAEPYMGQISMVGFSFAPKDWAFCDGATLPIAQNQALYTLMGTTFGGDGVNTFALPDMRGRTPMHFGSNGQSGYKKGEHEGVESVLLTKNQIPPHSHQVYADDDPATDSTPGPNMVPAQVEAFEVYGEDINQNMNANATSPVGNNGYHNNMQPSLVVNFIIAIKGYYPPRQN